MRRPLQPPAWTAPTPWPEQLQPSAPASAIVSAGSWGIVIVSVMALAAIAMALEWRMGHEVAERHASHHDLSAPHKRQSRICLPRCSVLPQPHACIAGRPVIVVITLVAIVTTVVIRTLLTYDCACTAPKPCSGLLPNQTIWPLPYNRECLE